MKTNYKFRAQSAIVSAMVAVSCVAQTPRVAAVGGNYIGVMMQEVDAERAKTLKLHEEVGVEITVVEPDSPAEKAGLKAGDVVLKYNGQRVEGMQQFARMVRETPTGRDVKVDISRGGVAQTVTVRVAQRKVPRMESGEAFPAPIPMERWDIHVPDLPRTFMALRSSTLGVEAESIDGQLAQYFGVKEGVLVRSVMKSSAAEKAGIKAGDVIMKIDDARVATPADISGKLRSLGGTAAPVVLMRDHRELTVTVNITDGIQVNPFIVPPNQ